MDCAQETALLRREVGNVEGVQELAFDLTRSRMAVTGQVQRDAIETAVSRTGMRAEPWSADQKEDRTLLALSTALSGASLLAGLLSSAADGPTVPFYLLSVAAGIWHVLPRAVLAVRFLRPDMHLLMCVAIAGAIAIGEWTEAAAVAFLYSLSLALEAWSVGRARHAVEALLELAPATATLLDGQEERRVPAEEVKPKSRILVKPGERLPLDGIVLEGTSSLDESPITGESMPVQKRVGDPAYAGAINAEGALVIETTRAAGDTTVAHMAELVEAASARRSRSERWVERFARVYTPAVMGLALLVLVAPPLLLGAEWSVWLYRALVLLVIACPCALVISTPVSIVAGLTAAARHGVLIKSGEFLETPARLMTMAFDKTGTLTQGRLRVVEVVAYDDHDEDYVLQNAAAIETRSEHPIARAVVAAARARGLQLPHAEQIRAVGGKGMEGVVGGKRTWVGSHRWLDELGEEDARVHERLEEMAGPGRSVLFLGSEKHVCGLIAVADEIRPDAKDQIEALRTLGIRHLVMLSGDNRPTAEAIARAVGIDEIQAELLPEQKLAAIEGLPSPVAMVGDGINDAPAMARSDLGIAMGAAGSDAAIETADIALMKDDLSRLPWLVGHSRRTLAIIRQNVTAALVVKAAFVLLTFLGTASLWAAITADMGVSLAVVFNALRLLRG
jgi:Cd2+/Zn2+-exporting ATPase